VVSVGYQYVAARDSENPPTVEGVLCKGDVSFGKSDITIGDIVIAIGRS
jgi:hypothetical protein